MNISPLLNNIIRRTQHPLKQSAMILAMAMVIGLAASCEGEDRRGEQPFAPTVRTLPTVVGKHDVQMVGQILTSPNSKVIACGFHCGNDTLKLSLPADVASEFKLNVNTLEPGRYYVVAYATNGIGTSTGDTLYFDMPKIN